MTQVVSFTKQGKVGVVTLNNPPVNALSHAVRTGISAAFASALADTGVEAIVIACEGRTFVAGADIREFGKVPLTPDVPEVVELVGASPKPVVAALHGTTLGGGLELALACDYRVAAASTKLGLPEVTLGILPGAGGTQRLPRLVGVRAALDLVVSGTLIGAKKAQALGLVDEVVEGDPQAAALAFAERVIREQLPLRKASERNVELAEPDLFEVYARDVARERRGLLAPLRCIQAVRAAVELPFGEGLLRERELFRELMASSQAKAQQHVFFAERDVLRPPGLPEDAVPRSVKTVGVVGDGSAGGSIAACFADAKVPVILVAPNPEGLDRELDAARRHYASAVAAGALRQAEADERMASIRPSLSFVDLREADLVVEAVTDDPALKREVFSALDSSSKRGAIWATNATRLDLEEVSALSTRPEDVVGMHFFAGAGATKALENTRTRRTLPDVCATVMKVGRTLGRVPVLTVAGAGGLASTRMLGQFLREAFFLLEEGALPEQVDRVLYEFGFPVGPLAACERGGPYQWFRRDEGPDRLPPAGRGVARRSVEDAEILERCLYAAVNEGARVLAEGLAPRPLELDLLWIHGLGFPVHRGGPLFWADQLGLKAILEAVERYRERVAHDSWNPAPLLQRLAGEGKGFYG